MLGISYANLRINYRYYQQLTHPISNLHLTGNLISPINKLPKTNQIAFNVINDQLAGKTLLLNFPDSLNFKPGHNYTISANLIPLNSITNIAAFDYQEHLFAKNINGIGFINNIIMDNGFSYYPSSIINYLRVTMINYLHTTIGDQQYAGLAIALVTGYQKFISQAQWQTFKNTGISHIVSISGLHITLVTGIFILIANWLLKLIPPTKIPKQMILAWIGIIAALGYSLMAGFSIPTQRAFYLILVIGYLSTIRHKLNVLQTLSIALSIVLIIEPLAIKSNGFWLSFGLVAIIFTFAASSAGKSNLYTKNYQWLRMQLILSLVSFPIALYLFKTYPSVSVIANLWAIPVLGNLMTPLVLISSLIHWDWLLIVVISMLDYVMIPLNYLAKFDPYWQKSPSLSLLVLSYCGIFMFLAPKSIAGKNLLGVSLFTTLFFVITPSFEYGKFQLISFANNQAGIALLQTQSRNYLIMNHDPNIDPTAALKNTILPYLQQQYINQLEVISQPQLNELSWQLFSDNQINLNKVINNNFKIDGNHFAINYAKNGLAVKLSNNFGINYIGNGFYPFDDQAWNNIVILNPTHQLTWLFNNPSNKLIINYPSSFSRGINYFSENLNLATHSIYDVVKLGSVVIDQNNLIILNSTNPSAAD